MNFLDRTFQPRIDLAREADFAIGALKVRPSRCEIEAEGARHGLQRRVMQVLVALAHPSAEVVSQDELISRCWGGLAVGEDAVGRCIGQLRRIAARWTDPPFEITTIPGVGYRLDAAAGAEPKPAERAVGAGPRRGAWSHVMAAVGGVTVLLAALGLWLGHGLLPAKAAPSRVAILPFEPLTSSPAERAFAAGLADELQSVLSASPMQVVSREEAATLRGAGHDERLSRLGVRLLFDGTVTTDRDTLRARVHLDDAGKHVTLWSVDLSGPASNPDALEAQVGARAIAVMNCAGQALRPRQGLADPETLALYLRGCDLVEDKGWGDDSGAIYGVLDTFRQVTKRAPDFAPGHSALAKFIAYYIGWLRFDQARQLTAEADREARRALAIDPKDADAYVALSVLRPVSDYAGRERLLDQALAANPSWPSASSAKSDLLLETGRIGEALAYAERAEAANPLSLEFATDAPLAMAGQTAAANAELDRMYRLWPRSQPMWFDRVEMYAFEARWDDMLKALDDRDARPKDYLDTDIQLIRTVVLAAKSGKPANIAEARRLLMTTPIQYQAQLNGRFGWLSRWGFIDDAYAMADRYVRADMNSMTTPVWFFAPDTAAMRRDPRFIALAARLGLVDYWRATGKWPDFCAEPGLPYDCKTEAAKLSSK